MSIYHSGREKVHDFTAVFNPRLCSRRHEPYLALIYVSPPSLSLCSSSVSGPCSSSVSRNYTAISVSPRESSFSQMQLSTYVYCIDGEGHSLQRFAFITLVNGFAFTNDCIQVMSGSLLVSFPLLYFTLITTLFKCISLFNFFCLSSRPKHNQNMQSSNVEGTKEAKTPLIEVQKDQVA
ncbi:hypothetical protein P8452_46696 [Trifolium repens]|nr:hypothetical protein P8452_46696 [Trifolium repens]